jgi:hypothetical protein
MAAQFVNYNKSVLTNFSHTLNRTIPASPSSINIALFRFQITTANYRCNITR